MKRSFMVWEPLSHEDRRRSDAQLLRQAQSRASNYLIKLLQRGRDRAALIDLIRTGMVQPNEDGTQPKLSREVRDAVRVLTNERNNALKGVALRVPKRDRPKK